MAVGTRVVGQRNVVFMPINVVDDINSVDGYKGVGVFEIGEDTHIENGMSG